MKSGSHVDKVRVKDRSHPKRQQAAALPKGLRRFVRFMPGHSLTSRTCMLHEKRQPFDCAFFAKSRKASRVKKLPEQSIQNRGRDARATKLRGEIAGETCLRQAGASATNGRSAQSGAAHAGDVFRPSPSPSRWPRKGAPNWHARCRGIFGPPWSANNIWRDDCFPIRPTPP